MLVKNLEKTVKIVTNQKNYLNWIQEGSFKLTSTKHSIENEIYVINFDKFNETSYYLSVLEIKSKKSVSLFFNKNSLYVISSSCRKILFFHKRFVNNYSLTEESWDSDINVKFVWRAIPEYLINLR